MFTPDSLLELAVTFDESGLAAFRIGDPSEGRSLQQKSRDLQSCAWWMEHHGITEAPMIGPFGGLKIADGSSVLIKKGAIVHGTGRKKPTPASRSYVVTVHRVDDGFVCDPIFSHDGKIRVRNQTVHWAGAGGYWRWTDTTNVEVVKVGHSEKA